MVDTAASRHLILEMINEVWTAGDLDALPHFWSEDCVNHAASGDPVGLTALRTYHEEFMDQLAGFSDTRIAVVQQVADTERVVTHLLTHARHTGTFAGITATGRDATLATIRIDRLRDGKITEHWSVADVASLMQQLQTSTPPG